ncbi:hypothetical protein BT63DRAFT_450587 [Microthyrium microscopicum]|uniref:Uncharacterized protein n=1 Tax=Microthyrium microscopicum TaxID=703497 RepID=A0A6A6UM33_9PEZI|nr:hypothetical protein BT63DRAFT_450587 [Microthyrium microscopicum]
MVYIESKEQEARNAFSESQRPLSPNSHSSTNANANAFPHTTADSMPAYAPIDPLLNALGLAYDPSSSVNGSSGTNADLVNWFNGNQQINGLLEDDLSYLDDFTLNFSNT